MKDEIKEILEYFRRYMSDKDKNKISKIEKYIIGLQEERDYLYNKLSFEIEQLCKVIEQTNKDIYIEERYDSED